MNIKIFVTIFQEYGLFWIINRGLYYLKLKIMTLFPKAEVLFEERIGYPKRVDIFDIDIKALKMFIYNLPEEYKERLIEQADNACIGRILGFSSLELDYGYPIKWQLNPLTGKECDIKKRWHQIPDFDKERGDIKVIWEISRFSHFIILARAYLLTGDKKYYMAYSEQLRDWLDKNPYAFGANYKCGQECSLRMVNALLAYTVFEKSGITTKEDNKSIKILIERCYRKIMSNFFYAYKCIKNNHTISELMGMIIASWTCEDDKQLSHAFRVLDEVIAEQFTDDGGYVQYSFNYERLALQDLEVVLSIEENTGCHLNSTSRKKILSAVKLMYQCQDECGDMPNYGSNDGALAFPVTSCSYRDFRSTINTIYSLLREKRLYDSGIFDEELIWFRKRGLNNLSQKIIEKKSCVFQEAGLYTLRANRTWLMFVLGNYKSRPAHMDQMHIDLWINGVNVLCDAGTFSYTSEIGKKLVYNEGHNTVVYDNKLQMNMYGAFMIYGRTRRKEIKFNNSSLFGKLQSQNGYTHERGARLVASGYEIIDIVKGEDGKKFDILFHTPCEILKKNEKLILIYGGKIICSISFDAPYQISKFMRSLYYLKSDEINCIKVSGVVHEGSGKIKTVIKYFDS